MSRRRLDFDQVVQREILKAVESRPRTIMSLLMVVPVSESGLRRLVFKLIADGKLRDYGSAANFGYVVNSSAVRAYGLPGDVEAGDADLDVVEAAQLRRRSKSGSGVIAPQPYATGYRWGNV